MNLMLRDDQYFKPGDKVMRVGNYSYPVYQGGDAPNSPPQYGLVYCVEDFWEGPDHNSVMLVGFGGWRYWHGMKVGWRATNFRKVEEIKLCVRAVEKMREPEMPFVHIDHTPE